MNDLLLNTFVDKIDDAAKAVTSYRTPKVLLLSNQEGPFLLL
jgi:hypothetical protein